MDVALVKELRDKTNVGMMACKKALQESNGDIEKAVEILRKKGVATAEKKLGRATKEGLIKIKTSEDKKTAVMVEVNCETDFAARNEKFKKLVDNISNKIILAEEEEICNDKIVDNGLDKKINKLITDAVGTIGENMQLKGCMKYTATDGVIGAYVHMGGKIGVLVELKGDVTSDIAKDIAMQIAAANPDYVERSQVPQDILEKEKEIIKEQIKGKPEQIMDKIVSGKIEKYYEEKCLIDQIFVKDSDKKVRDVLENVSIKRFTRFQLGA